MSGPIKDPRRITEAHLRRTALALLNGDFETFSMSFHLPHSVETFNDGGVLETSDDLRQVFENVRAQYERLGVTDIVRHCVNAEFRDASHMIATHETRLLSGATLVQAPYPVYSVLKKFGNEWKGLHSSYAVTGNPDLEAAITSSCETPFARPA